jgi:U3 small nucleolar RNA-associated protein 13
LPLSFSENFGLQVWALAVGRKTEMLATGGSDAVVNLWLDSTAADKEEAFRKEVS